MPSPMPPSRSAAPLRLGTAFFLSLALAALLPAGAHAVVSPMGSVLCGVIEFIYGNFGRALATLAVISLGVGAMLGKVSWGLAITVVVGIGVMFGAGGLTKWILSAAGAGGWIGCNVTGG